MNIPGRDLAIGDVIRIHDWLLHVVDIDRDLATAVRTAEFDFLLHFLADELVEVLSESPRRADTRPPSSVSTSAARPWIVRPRQ